MKIFYNVITKLFLIFFVVFNLIKFESESFLYIDYCYSPHITCIELVDHSRTSQDLLSIQALKSPDDNTGKYEHHQFDNTEIENLSYLMANHDLSIYLPQINHSYSPSQKIISFLHKINISHQNSDEESC